jgi:hypothetical protein
LEESSYSADRDGLGNAYLATARYLEAIRKYQDLLEKVPDLENIGHSGHKLCAPVDARKERTRCTPTGRI